MVPFDEMHTRASVNTSATKFSRWIICIEYTYSDKDNKKLKIINPDLHIAPCKIQNPTIIQLSSKYKVTYRPTVWNKWKQLYKVTRKTICRTEHWSSNSASGNINLKHERYDIKNMWIVRVIYVKLCRTKDFCATNKRKPNLKPRQIKKQGQ